MRPRRLRMVDDERLASGVTLMWRVWTNSAVGPSPNTFPRPTP